MEISGDHVRVDMGAPKLGPKTERLDIGSSVVSFRYISMGNPHAVILVESLDGYPVEIEGPVMEKHPRFPKRTNLEFVEVIKAGAQESSKSQRNARANSKSSKAKVKVRVWE